VGIESTDDAANRRMPAGPSRGARLGVSELFLVPGLVMVAPYSANSHCHGVFEAAAIARLTNDWEWCLVAVDCPLAPSRCQGQTRPSAIERSFELEQDENARVLVGEHLVHRPSSARTLELHGSSSSVPSVVDEAFPRVWQPGLQGANKSPKVPNIGSPKPATQHLSSSPTPIAEALGKFDGCEHKLYGSFHFGHFGRFGQQVYLAEHFQAQAEAVEQGFVTIASGGTTERRDESCKLSFAGCDSIIEP